MTNEDLKSLLPGCPETNHAVLAKVRAGGFRGFQTQLNGSICAECAQRLVARGIGGVFVNSLAWHVLPGETLKTKCSLCGETL
jgi:hypothetical protein